MEELSIRAKQVFELMRQYSLKNNMKTMGSEYIILAMYETEDSLCHFLLSEYEITKEEIMDKTKDVYILRILLGYKFDYIDEILSLKRQESYYIYKKLIKKLETLVWGE